jgi:hypothetical protein
VCLETPAARTVSCEAKIESSTYSGSYEIEAPAGSYRVYAVTDEVPNFKAYYTQCSDPSCSSHAPAVIKVEEGEIRTGVDPSWADRPSASLATDDGSGSEYTDMNATDMNSPDPETSSDEPVDE